MGEPDAPLSADDLFDAALSAKLRGELDKAVDAFTHVIQGHPFHAQAYLQLGRTEILRGNVAAAADAFRGGLKVNARSAPLLAELGFVQLVQGDGRRAEKVLRAALKLSKRNVRALTGLGWLYVQREDWGKAVGMVDQLLGVSGSNFAGHYLKAQIHEAMNSIADAQQEWFLTEGICREMIDVAEGQSAAPQYYLGEIMRVTRSWGAAREIFEAAAEQAPEDGSGYLFGMGMGVPWAVVLQAAATACAESGDADAAAAWRARVPEMAADPATPEETPA